MLSKASVFCVSICFVEILSSNIQLQEKYVGLRQVHDNCSVKFSSTSKSVCFCMNTLPHPEVHDKWTIVDSMCFKCDAECNSTCETILPACLTPCHRFCGCIGCKKNTSEIVLGKLDCTGSECSAPNNNSWVFYIIGFLCFVLIFLILSLIGRHRLMSFFCRFKLCRCPCRRSDRSNSDDDTMIEEIPLATPPSPPETGPQRIISENNIMYEIIRVDSLQAIPPSEVRHRSNFPGSANENSEDVTYPLRPRVFPLSHSSEEDSNNKAVQPLECKFPPDESM